MKTEDYKSLAIGAALAAAGAAATFVQEWLTSHDLGEYKTVVAAAYAVAINYLRKRLGF
jgi:hypothetical protein